MKDIFLNTPNQAAWFERYITDWTGPDAGRLGRIRFRMKDSVFPGDRMVFRGSVESVETDDTGCAWANVALEAGGRRPRRDRVQGADRDAGRATGTTPGSARAINGSPAGLTVA